MDYDSIKRGGESVGRNLEDIDKSGASLVSWISNHMLLILLLHCFSGYVGEEVNMREI